MFTLINPVQFARFERWDPNLDSLRLSLQPVPNSTNYTYLVYSIKSTRPSHIVIVYQNK